MHPKGGGRGQGIGSTVPLRGSGENLLPASPHSGGCQHSLACGCIAITLILKAGIFKSVCSICTPPAL